MARRARNRDAASTAESGPPGIPDTGPNSASEGKPVVIVESPAKSKTINRILGNDYIVRACLGHVRDLPKRSFGVDLENGFAPTYKLLTKRKELVQELKKLASVAPAVYLATDPDREGEAISWHLQQALKLPDEKVRRVTFHEITRDAVLKAFQTPGRISMSMVHAQQARRIMDRIVGYKLSPLLWERIAERLSAGRVQSVALKLVVDREREIRDFKPEEFWKVTARFDRGFEATLKDPEVKTEAEARALVEELQRQKFVVAGVTQKSKFERPYPPLTTALLQQKASIELGYSAKRTMMIAQQLYEGVDLGELGPTGLITYMRTDSFRIADEALRAVRRYIRETFGDNYLPPSPIIYKTRSRAAQEAHECIRPTHVELTPEAVRPSLTPEQYRLYSLIWRRFVACQMREAVYLTTEAEIRAGRALFVARGRELKFDGFMRVQKTAARDEQVLPALTEGETLTAHEIVPTQHFTEPPPRYTEASLIKALEKFGIGRPSTYAPTLSTIQDRGYVRKQARMLVPTELGVLVTEKLERHFPTFINTRFTAQFEELLDAVEQGREEWTKILQDFFRDFAREFERAREEMKSVKNQAVDTCSRCGQPMILRWNRFGKLIECTNETCKHRKAPRSSQVPGQICPNCRSPMVLKFGRRGRFLACSAYPDCRFTRTIVRDRIVEVPPGFELKCEKSGHPMAVRLSRRGAFLGCTGYPACRNAKKIPPDWLKPFAAESPLTGLTPEELEDPPDDPA